LGAVARLDSEGSTAHHPDQSSDAFLVMPITARVGSNRWIEILFTDPYTREESEQVMKGIFARLGLPRPLRFLVDVRQSTPPDAEFVIGAITFWQLHISDMWGARIAIITSTDEQTAMAELSEHSARGRELPFELRAFPPSDLSGATAWLTAPTR
jgi:hypothetical protein